VGIGADPGRDQPTSGVTQPELTGDDRPSRPGGQRISTRGGPWPAPIAGAA